MWEFRLYTFVLGVSVPVGLISIALTGQARTPNKAFNFDFEVTQMMMITFDGAKEEFAVAPLGTPTVVLLGIFGKIIESDARPEIQTAVFDAMKTAASDMAGELTLSDRKSELISQLQSMDDGGGVAFTNAAFTADGVIVRGNIMLSPRRAATTNVDFTYAKDGYSAFESWIPGGVVDSFNWTWKWYNNGGPPGSDSLTDRFVLRRPPAKGQGKFGMALGINSPLPGLDGMGQVCLVISGTRIHAVTGEMTPVTITRKCKKFGFDVRIATPDRLFLREWTPGPRDPIGPVAESAIHQVNIWSAGGHGANTLIVRSGRGWSREIATALRDGLANSHRHDAGLVVLFLVGDGQLMRAEPALLEEMRALSSDLEAPLVVNEDVEGSWAKALRIEDRDALEWRLVTPTGGVTWGRSGDLGAHDLAAALDAYLFKSPVAGFTEIMNDSSIGSEISSLSFESDVIGRLARLEEACPPPPFHGLAVESVATFLKAGSTSSDAAIRATVAGGKEEEGERQRILILDGGTQDEAERMREMLPDAMVVADPDGKIARRFGVRSWPSTMNIDSSGTVVSFEETHHE